MTHKVCFPVSSELKDSFTNVKKETRFILVGIEDECFVMKKIVELKDDFSSDFRALRDHLDRNSSCIILFRERQFGEKQWVLITYTPDSSPVQQKMTLSTSISHLKEQLGTKSFIKEWNFSQLQEFEYNNYKEFYTEVEKPWSKVELAHQELNKSEKIARDEAISRDAVSYSRHSITYSLDPELLSAVEKLKSKSVNWIKIVIEDEKIKVADLKKIQVGELSSSVDRINPHFYLYDFRNSIILIYCCPDEAPKKSRVLYSSSKATFADQLKSLGVNVIRRCDVYEPSKIDENFLSEKISQKCSTLFKPTEKMMKENVLYNERIIYDNRNRIDNQISPLAQAMGLGRNSEVKKSIVRPPKSAYQ